MGYITLVISIMMAGAAFGSPAQNANKSGAKKPAAKPAKPAAGATGQTTPPASSAEGAAKAPAKHRHRRPAARGEVGVPSGGPGACVERLDKLAEKDPLISYEGAPSRIVNDGLLWNSPHSKCAVTDEAAREKVFSLATAWQEKNSSQVRSILADLKSTMPPPEHKPMMHPRKHKAAKTAASGAPAAGGSATPSMAGTSKSKTSKPKTTATPK